MNEFETFLLLLAVSLFGNWSGQLLFTRRRMLALAWRFRRQRNAESRRANQMCAEVVLKDYEVRRWKAASYTLGSMVDDQGRAVEVLKNQLAKAELEVAKSKIPNGL